MKMIRSPNCSRRILFSAIVCWISRSKSSVVRVLGNIPLELDRFSVDSVRFTIFTRFHEPFNLSNGDVHEICQDKQQNQSKRVPLISTAWLLCHVSESFSFMELYSIHIYHPSDSRLISVKCRTTVWPFRSPCSWWYVNTIDNVVQDVLPPSMSRTWISPRSSRWRRSLACRLPVDDQIFVVHSSKLSQAGQHTLQRQSCANGILCRFRHGSPRTGDRIWIRMPLENSKRCFHSNLWQRVSPHQHGLNSSVVLRMSPGCLTHSNPVLLEGDWQASTPNSSLSSISPPHVPFLQVFLPALSSSTWFESCWLDWNGCKRTSKKTHDVERTKKMIWLITGKVAFRQ